MGDPTNQNVDVQPNALVSAAKVGALSGKYLFSLQSEPVRRNELLTGT